MSWPGAVTSGFMANSPPQSEGPRDENQAMVLGESTTVAPTAKEEVEVVARLAGLTMVPGPPVPLLPAAKTRATPAASQLSMASA